MSLIRTVSNTLALEEKLYFTVKELTQKIKSLIEEHFLFLWIEGEISNLKHSQNGHIYFNLVEEDALIKVIIFKDQRMFLSNEILNIIRNGLKVLVYGKITFFQRSGEIYLSVKKIEPLGIGLLQFKKEYLYNKYKHLFDPKLKRPIPPFPQKIVLITSLFSAALQDFLKISKERWGIHILVYPVKVQGESAHLEIVKAIEEVNKYFSDVDLILITRGGGSIEDLAPFYTEELLLAIRSSKIPIVSAVGHEIDVTLCDLAADKRCPTPSSAAHEILPDKKECLKNLELYKKKFSKLLEINLIEREKNLKALSMELIKRNPLQYYQNMESQLKKTKLLFFQKITIFFRKKGDLLYLLKNKLDEKNPAHILALKEEKVNGYKKLLFSLSPYNILERGYSIVKKDKRIIKATWEVREGDLVEIILSKGKILAKVIEKEEGFSYEKLSGKGDGN